MKTSIIIFTDSRLEYTKLCIDSIRKYTKGRDYEIIVVDNNSADGTVEWLKEQDDIIKILNIENLGFARKLNQGIGFARGDNIIFLNNDVVVTPRWLDNLTACLYSSQTVGAVSPVTNNRECNQAINTNYKNIDEMFEFADKHNKTNILLWEERIKLSICCMLIKKEVIDKAGLPDERFMTGDCRDYDYSFRIRKSGYGLMLCKDTFIHRHGCEASSYQLIREDERRFREKWGFDVRYSTGIRQDIIDLFNTAYDEQINVLEVGCACGATLLKIKDTYKKANLYGIELNEECAEIAGCFAKVKTGNIEHGLIDYPDNFFDYIIFGDVLEHLNNPWEVVSNIRRNLKSDGQVIASIPNVMHYSVLRNLINGNWTYEEAGLLDRTHLRFFTWNEIDKMFKEAGYENLTYIRKLIYMTNDDVNFMRLLNQLTGRDMTWQYETYQYIVKARNNGEKNIMN